MIDGDEKRKCQFAFELQSFSVFEKRRIRFLISLKEVQSLTNRKTWVWKLSTLSLITTACIMIRLTKLITDVFTVTQQATGMKSAHH